MTHQEAFLIALDSARTIFTNISSDFGKPETRPIYGMTTGKENGKYNGTLSADEVGEMHKCLVRYAPKFVTISIVKVVPLPESGTVLVLHPEGAFTATLPKGLRNDFYMLYDADQPGNAVVSRGVALSLNDQLAVELQEAA